MVEGLCVSDNSEKIRTKFGQHSDKIQTKFGQNSKKIRQNSDNIRTKFGQISEKIGQISDKIRQNSTKFGQMSAFAMMTSYLSDNCPHFEKHTANCRRNVSVGI